MCKTLQSESLKKQIGRIKPNPKLFIHTPYTICPECKKKSLGVFTIYNQSFSLKCYKCGYSSSENLPNIEKKLIYLDQFVISNIMNSLDKKSPKYKKIKKDTYWLRLFTILSRLIQAQVIICPYSRYHFKESLSTPVFNKLKKLYKHLSYGVQLNDHQQIFNYQVQQKFEEYISTNRSSYSIPITMENYNKWEDRLQINLEFNISEEEKDAIHEETIEMHKGLIEIIQDNWQKHKKSLDESYREEIDNYGPAVARNYIKQCSEFGETTYFPGSLLCLFSSMLSICRKYNIPEDKHVETINTFLTSGIMNDIPYARNSSYMFAAVRQKIQSGMKPSSLSQGTNTDIIAISTYIPYVDAMFIDDEQANYIAELTKQKKFNYKCRVFSTRTKEDFIQYLSELEAKIPKSHFELVGRLYGPNWTKPYLTMFEK
jgi:hypothetical protein